MTVDQCAALNDVLLQMEQAARFSPCYLAVHVLPLMVAAIPLTLLLTAVCGVIGNLLAVPVAVARISPNPLLWMPSYVFILLMRGTPLIVQIYLIYYGLGQVFGNVTLGGERLMQVLPFLKDGIWYAIFALSINTAGYSVVFFQARLYGDASLNVVYCLLGIAGWYLWLFGGERRTELRISRTGSTELGAPAASRALTCEAKRNACPLVE